MRVYWLVLLFVLAGMPGLSGQENGSSPIVHTFSPAEYNGGNQNWGVTQDEHGLLYVANTIGILRYDGVDWSTLLLPGSPTVRTVAATQGRLFAGGYGEFGYFTRPADADPVWHSLSTGLSGPDANEEIWNIEILADGKVAFQSFGRLFLYDGQRLETIIPPGVMMFARAYGQGLAVPVTGQGIFYWQPGQPFAMLPGTEALGNREVAGMVVRDKALILGLADGIFRWEEGELSPWSAEVNTRLAEREINRLSWLHDGKLAIGTITSGLYLLDPADDSLSQLSEESVLSNNTVLAIFESSAGNVWLGLDLGIDLVVRSRLVSHPTGNARPPGAVYAAIQYQDRTYLGTNQGLYWWDGRNEDPVFRLVAGTAGHVWELRATPQGLLCGHNDGTFLIAADSARLISDRSGGWQTVAIEDANGSLLQVTYTGLQIFRPTAGGFAVAGIEGFSAPVRFLRQTGKRQFLALHGSRGAYQLELSKDFRELVQVDTLLVPPLIKAGMELFGDTLLVQSKEGVYHYDNGTLRPLDSFRGVPLEAGNYCIAGREKEEWFLYQPDRVGVYRGKWKLVDLPIRLRFPYPVIIPWGESEYLFLLDEGYARVSVAEETCAGPALLLRSGYRTAAGWHTIADTIQGEQLPHANNDLRFTYALPVFDRPVRYRSRLAGYGEGSWSAWTASGQREFTSLPAGNYCFEVEANWFGGRAEHCFTILPPWYLSRWAYLVYALLIAVAGRMLYILHVSRLKRQARQLEVIRKRELQRERIMTRNRELKTDIKRKSRELANTTLALAKKNEMLLALREELAKGRKNQTDGIDHRKVGKLIDQNLNNEEDWAIFESYFDEVHEAFLTRLRKRHPELTTGDLKLAAYLRMDLSSKEIAPLLHISVRGVENKRYRLRKKLELEGGDDLNRYLLEF